MPFRGIPFGKLDTRYLQISNNLSDVANAATARTNLDVYSTGEVDSTFLKLDASNDPVTGDLLLTPTSDSTSVFQVQQSDQTVVLNVDTTNARIGVGTATPFCIFSIEKPGELFVPHLQLKATSTETSANVFMSFCRDNTNDTGYSVGLNSGNNAFIISSDGNSLNPAKLLIDVLGNIGINTSGPAAKLHVVGSADDQQLIVQANATQTANILEVQDSGANVLAGFDERGILFSDGGIDTESVYIGKDVGNTSHTNATRNVGIGTEALDAVTTGDRNVAIGYNTGTDLTEGRDNLLIGSSAGANITTGINNMILGSSAGQTLTTASNNVLIGRDAGARLTTGSSNIFIGREAGDRQTENSNLFIIDKQSRADAATELTNAILYGVMNATATSQTLRINAAVTIPDSLLVDGSSDEVQATIQANATQTANIMEVEDSSANVLAGFDERGILFSDGGIDVQSVYIGKDAGRTAATGILNIGIGDGALKACTTGTNNIAIGVGALDAVTSGNTNTGIGTSAGSKITTGIDNVAIGNQTLQSVTTASFNMGVGTQALRSCTGAGNAGIGVTALRENTTGTNNVGIGYQAGYYNQTGSTNTSIGYRAGFGVSGNSNSNNTFIGARAGEGITTGGSNAFIGYYAGYRQTTNSNLLIIDNQIRADAATEQTNAILYGVMNATATSQTLRINAQLGIQATPTTAGITFGEANNLVFGTTTGTKIGTATNQKLGFFNVTPVVQQATIADADGTLADITTKFNTLLAQIEALGLNASS